MAPITVRTDVDRSAEDVFAYAIDRRIGGADRPSTSEVVHVNPRKTWGVARHRRADPAVVDVTVKPLTADRSQ